jgi:hypothetical protein
VVLAQKTFDRTRQLAEHGNAPLARLDQATDSLHESRRALDQAKSAYEQAVNGYTREERQIAEATVGKATADIEAVKSIIDQMSVYAPVPILDWRTCECRESEARIPVVAAREWRWLLHNVSHAGAIDERDLYALYASIKDLRWIHDVCKVSQLVLISSSNMRTCDTNRTGTTAVTM